MEVLNSLLQLCPISLAFKQRAGLHFQLDRKIHGKAALRQESESSGEETPRPQVWPQVRALWGYGDRDGAWDMTGPHSTVHGFSSLFSIHGKCKYSIFTALPWQL